MELTGERKLPVGRGAAWKALNDPAVLVKCIPGGESLEKIGENEFAVVVVAALGPVRARFNGKLRVEDIVGPSSYTLRFEGQGGAAGFAKGTARVKLDDDVGQAMLRYAVDAQVGGKIAQVGSRLIDSAALKLADDFFAAFEQHLTAAAAPEKRVHAAPPGFEPQIFRRIGYMAIFVAVVVLGIILLR